METGNEKYYWVNNIVGMYATCFHLERPVDIDFVAAIGVLTNLEQSASSSLLKIDAWNVSKMLLQNTRYGVLTRI